VRLELLSVAEHALDVLSESVLCWINLFLM